MEKYNKDKIILGDKVKIRPITMEDTELIVKWRNKESVRKHFIFRDDFTIEMHKNWMKTKVETGEVVQFIIESHDDSNGNGNGVPIGSVYFRDVDMKNRSAEFGIFIGEDCIRGKGLGTEATRLFVEYGFQTLGLHRIMLRVLKENERALKSYLNVGFEVEGCAREMVYLDEKYHDVIFMSVFEKHMNN